MPLTPTLSPEGEREDGARDFLAADAEEDDVSVLDSVFATLDPQPASCAQCVHRAGGDELIHRGDLGADEMLLEVGVDLGGGDRRGRVALAWPCARLRLPRCEVGDQPARFPNRPGDATETRFVDAITGAHLGLLRELELAKLGLQTRRESDGGSSLVVGQLLDPGGRLTSTR